MWNHEIKIPERIAGCAGEITVNDFCIGGGEFAWIAGPCAVESAEMFCDNVSKLKSAGVKLFRCGLFKPRSSPDSFQGLRKDGIGFIAGIKKEFGITLVSEALDRESLQLLLPVADIIQIGSRNALNYELLKDAGRSGKPVLLKRGFSITVAEWLGAADYLAASGCREIIFCERGIRTVTEISRFTLDVAVIAWLRQNVPSPVIVDPSHAAGCCSLVPPLLMAGAAAGAQGALIEVNEQAKCANCDAGQQLSVQKFTELKQHLEKGCR